MRVHRLNRDAYRVLTGQMVLGVVLRMGRYTRSLTLVAKWEISPKRHQCLFGQNSFALSYSGYVNIYIYIYIYILPVIRVCFAACLMSHYFRYQQLTASGYLNLASVIAGPNTCGLTILATMQHETLGNTSMWSDSPPMYIYTAGLHVGPWTLLSGI